MADQGSALTHGGWLRAPAVDARTLDSMRDWFPVALDAHAVSWRHLPGRFTEPFFGDTLRAQPREQRRVCRTPHEWLGRAGPVLAPSVFIFHASRCGSTLLAQMLAALPQCVVQSEPPAVDDFFTRFGTQPPSDCAPLLRALVGALGQRRHGQESHYIVKLDCWHVRHLPLLRAAFPATPFWFLYREPEAILASHRRQRGPQMVPGLVLPPEFGAGLAPWDLEAYCARVIADIFGAALAHAGELRLLNYRQLPDVVWETLLAQLGIDVTPAQLEALRARAGFHAKAAAQAFKGDPDTAPAPRPAEAEALLAPLYARLEALRLARD
jgi:hypothetical protein